MKKGAIIILIGVFLDQLTKQLAYRFLYNPITGIAKEIDLLPYVLKLSYHENPAAAYGLFEGKMGLFIVVTIIALSIFGYLFKDVDFKTKRVYSISVTLFIAGTLGNFIDRIFLGFVIDFMKYPFLGLIIGNLGNFYNNLADMYLFIAIILFSIDLFIYEPKRQPKEVKQNEENISHS
jgi:signal peptidase II